MRRYTTAERIRRVLADDILSGGLTPGTPLDESRLAEKFAVSRTPVREALRLLAASGLVDHKPRTRTIVAKPDVDMLRGMFSVMGHLEALCASLAATAMDTAERAAIEALHAEMAATVRDGDRKLYAEQNDAFHSLIYQGAHNPYLAEITQATRLRIGPYRHAQFAALGRLARSHAEHDEIVEALLRGDRENAQKAMERHIVLVEGSVHSLTGDGRVEATKVG